jgi:hypothetical protein
VVASGSSGVLHQLAQNGVPIGEAVFEVVYQRLLVYFDGYVVHGLSPNINAEGDKPLPQRELSPPAGCKKSKNA